LEIQVDMIDNVIKKTVEVIESSKYQIFEICENALSERDNLRSELEQLKQELENTITKVDKLEMNYKLARIRLTEVSRDFQRFTESDIRRAYETATSFQLDLTVAREKEINLKARRDELQMRIRNSERTIERAEGLGSQMNVVLDYMSGDMTQVTRLLESAKNRQLIGLQIILAQEEERKRIARDIHDGAAQSIANVVLRAEIAERMMAKQNTEAVLSEIGDLKGQARSTLEEIRKIIFNLRPMALDDLGLVPILRKFTQDFEEKEKIRATFETFGKETRLPSAMEVAIYRLVQEAFTNIVKHAEATFVTLDITYQSTMTKITITDNGKGFTIDTSPAKMSNTSQYGLLGMRERVELLEGRFEIESNLNVGTTIKILIPTKIETRKE
jgi:two-component system sensor histidine kinase DegS